MKVKLIIYILIAYLTNTALAQISTYPFLGGSNDGFGFQAGIGSATDSCYFTGNELPDSLLVCNADSVLINAEEFFAESYEWSTGEVVPEIWVDSTAWYYVTVLNGSCSNSDSIFVWLPGPVTTVATFTEALSPFATNGEIHIEIVSGEAPFLFDWSDGTAVSDLINVASGDYELEVQDVAGCLYSFNYYLGFDTCFDKYANLTDDTITICAGDSVLLQNLYESPGDYFWSTGDTTTSIWADLQGTYTLSLSWPGCSSTIDSVVVLNSTLTNGIIDMTPATNFLYPDGSLSFSQTEGDVISAYEWSEGSVSETATNLAPGSYSLLITDVNGCEFSFTDSVIAAECYEYYVSLGPDQFACDGDELFVTASGTATGTYLWSDGSDGISNSGFVSDTLSITVSDGICSFTDTVFFLPTVLPNMDINITQASRPINLDGAVSISFPDDDPSDYSIVWSTGSTSFTITGLAYGTYYYTLTDSAGCIFNEEVYVPFNPCYTPYGITISDTTSTSFTVSWTGPTTANYIASYKNITTGGGFTSVAVPPGLTTVTIPASLGNVMKYRIKYTCDGVTSQSPLINFVMPSDSVLRQSREIPLLLYPNPTVDMLNLVCNECDGDYRIIDKSGRLWMQGTFNSALLQHNFSVSGLPSGIYTIQVIMKDATLNLPFIKME